MNILHISPVVYLDRLLTSCDLAGAQAKKGHNVSIIGANTTKICNKIAITKNLNVFLFPSINFPIPSKVTSTSFVLGLEDAIKSLKPDIIHVQTHLNATAVKAVRLANKFNIPAVITIHGVTAKINPPVDAAQIAYLRTIGKILFKNSKKIVCLTQQDSIHIRALGCPHEKIVVIPNGVDTELFQPKPTSETALIAWHGRFVPQKGLEYLIKAAKIVVENGYPAVKFVLVGNGPLKPKIISMTADLRLTNNIKFIGRLPSLKDIESFLNNATMYAIPSLREGMPWALLEVMACGKPVVGSDISGINDVITHGKDGLIVPPMNSKQLADNILQLLGDAQLRERIGHNARNLIEEKYNWDLIGQKIESVYRNAIKQHNSVSSR